MKNYEIYKYNINELMTECGIYLCIDAAISYVFYKSAIMFFVLTLGLPMYLRFRKKSYITRRRKKLVSEFSQMLYLVSSNLRAGYSMENAFFESCKEIKLFYGEKSLMADELLNIQRGLEMNISLEELFAEFANRTKAEDIMLFSDVLSMAKRNGGKIPEVLSDTADRVREKICTDNEIDLIISEKKLELRIMEVVPFLIPVYLEATSKGYFSPLYEDISGRLIMTACLIVYLVAAMFAERIIRIEI